MNAREYVLDSSAAAKWFRPEARAQEFQDFTANLPPKARLIVPPVFPFEVRTVVVKAVRAGEVAAEDALAAADLCLAAVRVLPLAPNADLAVALETGLSVPDAAYLCLARSRPLVTYDERLGKLAKTWIRP